MVFALVQYCISITDDDAEEVSSAKKHSQQSTTLDDWMDWDGAIMFQAEPCDNTVSYV